MFKLPSVNSIEIQHSSIDQNGRLALLYNALANGGTYFFDSYGIGTKIDNPQRYRAFDTTEREQRIVQYIAEGYTVSIVDHEDDEEVVGVLNLENLNKNFDKVPSKIIMQMLNEEDDAETGDNFIQTIAFGEVTYG